MTGGNALRLLRGAGVRARMRAARNAAARPAGVAVLRLRAAWSDQRIRDTPGDVATSIRRCLLLLGAAGLASGRPVDEVESELRRMGRALGEDDVQCAATPTGLFVSLGSEDADRLPRRRRAAAVRPVGGGRRGSSTPC